MTKTRTDTQTHIMTGSSPIHVPLHLVGLRKKMPGFVLNASFSVEVGERAALVGKSGSGKTTLLRLITGLDRLEGIEDQGKILLGSKDLTSLSPQIREIGYVSQDPALFAGLSVLENVAFGLRMRGVSRAERRESALSWLDKVGMKLMADQSVVHLSGGEKQRVAFLRAILWYPRVLLLDEPFSGLDVDLKKTLREELTELHRLWPVPLLLVTHDERDVESVATSQLELKIDRNSSDRWVSRS